MSIPKGYLVLTSTLNVLVPKAFKDWGGDNDEDRYHL